MHPSERSEAEKPKRRVLCTPAQKTTLKSQTLLCDDDRRGAFANKSFLKRGAGKDFFSKKFFPANPVIKKTLHHLNALI